MPSTDNRKKRKLDISNDRDHSQSSKKRKLSSGLQNIFDKQKELQKEINLLKQERDKLKNERDKLKKERNYFYVQANKYKENMNKYKQIHLQMMAIIKPSQQNNRIINTHNENVNTTTQYINSSANDIHDNRNNTVDEILITETKLNIDNHSDDNTSIIYDEETASNTSNKNMNTNRNIKRYNETHLCTYCSRQFNSAAGLGCHMRVHRKSKSKSKSTELEEINYNNITEMDLELKEFKCPRCDLIFSTQNDLFVHMRAVHKNPTICQLCKTNLNCLANLLSHSYIHQGIKPYICPKCKYSTRTRFNLRVHLGSCAKIEKFSYKRTKKNCDISKNCSDGDITDMEYCLQDCSLPESEDMIACDDCNDWFHFNCVDLTQQQINKIKRDNVLYSCPYCTGLLTEY
eukprot:2846_1